MAFVALEVYISHFDADAQGRRDRQTGQDANQSSMFIRFRDPAGGCVVWPCPGLG
jgi:hypothetical protein